MAAEKSAYPLLPAGAAANGADHKAAPDEDKSLPPGAGPLSRLCIAGLPARYMFAVQACVSFAIIYGMKVNLGVAINVMINNTAVRVNSSHTESGCPSPPDRKVEFGYSAQDGPFEWGEELQGHMLGSYFYGYLISQLPGAILSERFSGMWVMWGAVMLNVVACSLIPVCCWTHWGLVIMMRVIQGIGGGLTFPAMHCLIAHWSPPNERSMIVAIVYAGTALGTVISILLSGFIAKGLGWEWVFYLMSALCLPWCVAWPLVIADGPEKSKCIRNTERRMIIEAIGDSVNEETPPFPCKAVMKSKPFWAILVAHTMGNTGWYMWLVMLPKFMKQVLHKNIAENALVSAIPYLLLWLLSLLMGSIFKKMITNEKLKTITARNIANGIAFLVPAACLVGVSFIGCNDLAGTILIVIAVTAYGAMFVGYLGNHIDIAPNFAGTLMGITNTVATVPGILMPVLVGILTKKERTLARWSIAFFLVAAGNVFGFLFYFFFGAGVLQEWNEPKEKKEAADAPGDDDAAPAETAA